MTYSALKKRIKKNEGFSLIPYKDKLGFLTIGYGHLIKKNEKKTLVKNNNKKLLDELFEKDFAIALDQYKKFFSKSKHTDKEKNLLIEMIFQLGVFNLLKFKKMLFFLKNKKKYLTALEMMDSLWYRQTPKRVEDLIKNYLN